MAEANPLFSRLLASYVDHYPKEAASSLDRLTVTDVNECLKRFSNDRLAKILPYADFAQTALFIEKLGDEDFSQIMMGLDSSVSAALLSHQKPQKLDERWGVLPEHVTKELKELTTYPSDSAGRLMDKRFFSFDQETTVGKVLNAIRKHPGRKIYDVVVLNDERKFLGTLSLQTLATSQLNETLKMLSGKRREMINVFAPKDEVVEIFESSKVTTLPITNVDDYVVGVIRYDDLVVAAQEDATADLLTMVGANPEERALSSPALAVRKRLPWLSINLLTAFLASAVVGLFEGTIARITALAVLLPVVAGQSGNTGAQAMAVTMRGLALREVRARHWVRLVWKELRAGLLNGVAVAVMTSFGVFLWSGNLALCLVIGIAMVMSMAIASMSGAAVPMLLTALGKDPAQSSSIVLTTVTDIMGFFSFLGLATIFMHWLT